MNEKKIIKAFWRCVNCEESLPKTGFVWKWRFQYWLQDMRETYEGRSVITLPYYCDGCISLREA